MWFKVFFANSPSPLHVCIGGDGTPYFVAKDVGCFLNYKAPYNFAERHHTKNLGDVVPYQYSSFLSKTKKYVLGFEDMIRTMFATQSHHGMPVEDISNLRKLWYGGFVSGIMPQQMPFAYKCAFHLKIGWEGEVPFQNWIRIYAKETLRAIESRQEVLVAPPSVESNYADPEEMPTKQDSGFGFVVRAEGEWTVKSSDVFRDVIQSMKRKFDEMDPEKAYELQVRLIQK